MGDVREMDESEAVEYLQSYDGIGQRKAETAYRFAQNRFVEIERGNLSAHNVFENLAAEFASEVVRDQNAQIDEPVSTDTNRLIRLPGSLHGGSGLAVRRIDPDDLDAFDPLVDAVPAPFEGHDIAVDISDGGIVTLGGDRFTLEEGVDTVPEYLGVFLMTRGRAEKAKE
jgi:DNA primase small subunit